MTKPYELKPRRTAEDWDAVSRENPIAIHMRRAQRRTDYVLQGYVRACYLSGGAGLGKSFAISQAIRDSGVKPIRMVPQNHHDLIHAFEMSGGDIPLVLEECDHVFRSPRCLNLLKLATDTAGAQTLVVRVPPRRKSEVASTKTIPLPRKIVFALNGNLLNQREWPVECRPHIAALLSREEPISIDGNRTERWEYATYLAVRKRMLTMTEDGKKDIPLRIQNAAINWFATNIWRLSEVSPRRLVKITDLMMIHHQTEQASQRSGCTYDPGALEEDLEQFLLPQAGDLPQPPEVPAIFISPRETSSISKRAA